MKIKDVSIFTYFRMSNKYNKNGKEKCADKYDTNGVLHKNGLSHDSHQESGS